MFYPGGSPPGSPFYMGTKMLTKLFKDGKEIMCNSSDESIAQLEKFGWKKEKPKEKPKAKAEKKAE